MIQWNKYFDRIFCLHFAKYTERLPFLYSELKRVGILDSGIFQLYENTDTPLYRYIFNALNLDELLKDKLLDKECFNGFCASFGHYQISKIAELNNYKSILILEDDVTFLKNLNEIEFILSQTPENSDLTLYSNWCWDWPNMKKYYADLNTNNALFHKITDGYPNLGSGVCYRLSRLGTICFNGLQERKFKVTDQMWNYHYDSGKYPNFNIVQMIHFINMF